MKKAIVKIKGATLLTHNRQLADPINPIVRAKGEVNKKKAKDKTIDDHMKLSELEFFGGLYTDAEFSDDSNVYVKNIMDSNIVLPADNIKAALGDGAKYFRQGPKCKSSLTIIDKLQEFKFDGPKKPVDRWKKGFFLRKPIKQGPSVIVRTRPIFHNWEGVVEAYFDDEQIDDDHFKKWFDIVANLKGLCDDRPNHGRFEIEKMEIQDV